MKCKTFLNTEGLTESLNSLGNEFQRAGPESTRLDLNKYILGIGTFSFLDEFLEL